MGIWHNRLIDHGQKSDIFFDAVPKRCSSIINLDKGVGKLGLLSLPNPKALLYTSEASTPTYIAVDGKIYNKQALCLKVNVDENEGTSKIIIMLYEKYGSDGLYLLEGAFSLILVDQKKKKTLLYRSFLTGFPLYYVSKNNLLTVSTNPIDLLHRPDVSNRLDIEQLSGFFSLHIPAWTDTVFSEINEVSYGEIVMISSEGVHSQKRALSEILIPQKYHSESEIITRYRHLVQATVGKNISNNNTHGIMLSSGMDSSTLAVFASRHLKKYGSRLNAYSWSLPSYQMADETEGIKTLCKALDIKLTLFNAEKFTPFSRLDALQLKPDTPFTNPYWSMISELYKIVSNDGVDILFNGHFGDGIFPSTQTIFSDILRDGRYELFLPTMKSMVNEMGYLNTMKRLPMLQVLKRYLLRSRYAKKSAYNAPEWLSKVAKESGETAWKKNRQNAEEGYEAFSLALSKLNIDSGAGRYVTGGFGLERVEPFIDHELLNYTLRSPAYMTYRKGEKKYFAREAMRGLLPESIRTQSKVGILGSFARDGFMQNINEIKQRLFDEPNSWNGYVDERWMEKKFKKNAEIKDQEMIVIWMSLHMAPWQRAIGPGGKLYEEL